MLKQYEHLIKQTEEYNTIAETLKTNLPRKRVELEQKKVHLETVVDEIEEKVEAKKVSKVAYYQLSLILITNYLPVMFVNNKRTTVL